ncbi:MAG: hypothetical protein KJN90_14910 [Gammaproteobacteria bacterium]|nr:hypothetical protein [Gammaproteobacteria bacterium]
MSKYALLAIAALLFFQASAQERSVWTCRDSNNNGLRWDDRRWVDAEFRRSNFVLTLNGLESSLSINGQDIYFECRTSVIPEIIDCNDLLGTHLLFNSLKHVGTMSSILGGVTGPGDNSVREPLQVRVFQCMRVQTLGESARPDRGN